jgi:predicted homoserine dehydrogenase-like protein
MSLHRLAQQRAGKPVRVGLIGAGKFGSMFLNQIPTMPNVEIAVIADLDPERARSACRTIGWDAARIRRTRFVATGTEACADPEVQVVVEATGSPPAGKHIVMVNVEADVLAGPLLAEEARVKSVVYSLAYGDQPALTCELVDWARA